MPFFKSIILSVFVLGVFINIDLYNQTKNIFYLMLWLISCAAMLVVLVHDEDNRESNKKEE